jgi:ATP-dependent RNA helicase DeaD
VQLAHTAIAGDGDDREIPAVPVPPPSRLRPLKPARGRLGPRTEGEAGGAVARLFVGAGRRAGVRPGDLVGAITGEAGIESRSIGAIEIADGFSLVEVPEDMADEIVVALRSTKIRGLKPTVRRERG